MSELKIGRLGPFPRVNKPVFLTSVILITLFIIFGAFFNQQAEIVFNQAKAFVSLRFGWFFIVVINATVLMSIYMIFSRYGDIRLGHQNEKPEYKLISWIGMLEPPRLYRRLIYLSQAVMSDRIKLS